MERQEFIYYCERIKKDKAGFRERLWLDMPCKGWRIIIKRPWSCKQTGLQ